MRKLLTLSIPIVLGVGLMAALINDSDEPRLSAEQAGVINQPNQPSSPAVIEKPVVTPETTTTTVAAAPAPEPETTTTTVAPSTTTTTPKAKSAPAPRPTTTTTAPAPSPAPPAAAPVTIDCGTGTASAQASFSQMGTGYQLGAKVLNDSTKAIALDSLVVRAWYGSDPNPKTFTVNVAGKQVDARPNPNEADFSIPESASAMPPTKFEIAEFQFHTAGLPECSSR